MTAANYIDMLSTDTGSAGSGGSKGEGVNFKT